MARFTLGLVGAGRRGRTHLRAVTGSEIVAIVAVTDPAAASRDELAQSGMKVHAELDAMLDAGGLDGVLIAAPSDNHLALSVVSPTPSCRSCVRNRAAPRLRKPRRPRGFSHRIG